MTAPTTAAGQLAAMRWDKATAADRKAQGKMLTEARRKAKARRAQRRTQTVSRRSRKPNKPKPKA